MRSMARMWKGLAAALVGGALLFGLAPAAMAAPAMAAARDHKAPTTPANLRATSITDTDIVLAWDPSDANGDVVDYNLFFDNNQTPFFVGSDTTFDVHNNKAIGMVPGSTHTFKVQAVDAKTGRMSQFSNELTVSFAPGDTTPPTAPSNLRVVSNDSRGVGLAWDPSTDESSFNYFVDGGECPSDPIVVSGDQTQTIVPSINSDPVCGLLPGQTYTFSVRARDEFDNDSASSNSVTVTFNG